MFNKIHIHWQNELLRWNDWHTVFDFHCQQNSPDHPWNTEGVSVFADRAVPMPDLQWNQAGHPEPRPAGSPPLSGPSGPPPCCAAAVVPPGSPPTARPLVSGRYSQSIQMTIRQPIVSQLVNSTAYHLVSAGYSQSIVSQQSVSSQSMTSPKCQ